MIVLNWLYNRAEDQPVKLDSDTIHIKKGLPRGLPDQTYKGDKRSFYFWYEIDSENFDRQIYNQTGYTLK